MVWGAEITHEIMQAAITELYRLESFNAIHALAFFKKYGVHFQNKEDIRTEGMKRGYRFLGTPPHYRIQRRQFIESQFRNEMNIYDYK